MQFPFLVPVAMRLFVSLFFLSCLGSVVFLAGCDRPKQEMSHYGKIIDHIPNIPEAKEQFEIPKIEGIDVENITRRRL